MAQHDFNIANQGFPAFRADLNNALSATVTLSAGATEPSTTFAYQLWYDETADVLKIRNDDNDAWITLFTFDQATNSVQVSGEELVDDTTPELGGNLASNGYDIVMADNDKILLGTGSDGEIYHDGSNTIINDAGTGSLKLQIGGSDKVEVTSYGLDISGTAVADTQTASVSGSTTLDFDAYQNFVLTLTGNVTLANPSTEKVGQSGFIIFSQTAGYTVSLGTDYETAGGAGITLSASGDDIVPYVVMASGRILLGAPQLAFA